MVSTRYTVVFLFYLSYSAINNILFKFTVKIKNVNSFQYLIEYCMVVVCLFAARNAVIVLIAGVMAYALQVSGHVPFTLTGEVNAGIPPFKPPDFYLTYGNTTVTPVEIFSVIF